MKRYFVLSLAALVSIFIEGLFVQWLPAVAVPHLLVCLVVYLAFFDLSVTGALYSFMLGLLADFSTGIVVGPWAGALVITYGAISVISQRLFVHSGFVMFAAAASASFVSDLFYWLLVFEASEATTQDLCIIIGRAVVTGLLAPIVQLILSKFELRRGVSSGRIGLSAVGI